MEYIDVANNIKAVEMLKVEILRSMTELFADITAEADSDSASRLAEDAARLINMTFLLCGRLGVSYEEIYPCMKSLLKSGIAQQHVIEKRFGDLSSLLEKLG